MRRPKATPTERARPDTKPSARAKAVKKATERVKTHAAIDFVRAVRGR